MNDEKPAAPELEGEGDEPSALPDPDRLLWESVSAAGADRDLRDALQRLTGMDPTTAVSCVIELDLNPQPQP